MNIIGLHCGGHDTSAALIKDGNLICAFEEERFNREKHTKKLPINSIKECLKLSKLKIGIIPTIGSILAASLGSVLTFNTMQVASIEDNRPEFMLEDQSKNLIVQEIQKITGESDDFIILSGIYEKQITYSIKSKFTNNSNENCLNIEFDNLNYQDLTITEAVICDQDGLEKIVKLSFIKGPIQDI